MYWYLFFTKNHISLSPNLLIFREHNFRIYTYLLFATRHNPFLRIKFKLKLQNTSSHEFAKFALSVRGVLSLLFTHTSPPSPLPSPSPSLACITISFRQMTKHKTEFQILEVRVNLTSLRRITYMKKWWKCDYSEGRTHTQACLCMCWCLCISA